VGVGEIMGMERVGQWEGKESWFVAEADEYVEDSTQFRRNELWEDLSNFPARFLTLRPKIIVVNNLSWDHPDVYRSFEEVKQVFRNFLVCNLLPEGKLVFNRDDINLREIQEEVARERPDIEMVPFGMNIGGEIKLKIAGEHNRMNARAARATLEAMGEWRKEEIEEKLGEFSSTKRRLEWLGEMGGVVYIDDYAHHSDEITAAIQAVREWQAKKLAEGGRLVVAFQSHTYTRTMEFRKELVESLGAADGVVMTDIFPSAREDMSLGEQISSDDLCRDLNELRGRADYALNVRTNEELARYCENNLQQNDVLLCLGAGDIYHFFDDLKK
ncbi:Mur ligase family protein, partial [Microgenomates group bacterium]|nr:Mur ligase family protein [Microgenomates group bacterium]